MRQHEKGTKEPSTDYNSGEQRQAMSALKQERGEEEQEDEGDWRHKQGAPTTVERMGSNVPMPPEIHSPIIDIKKTSPSLAASHTTSSIPILYAPNTALLGSIKGSLSPLEAKRVVSSVPPTPAGAAEVHLSPGNRKDAPSDNLVPPADTVSTILMTSTRRNSSLRNPLSWLEQKKMKRKGEQMLKEAGSPTMTLPNSSSKSLQESQSTGARRQQSLFAELRENGVDEEEAQRRQRVYDMMRFAAGDMDHAER